MPQQGLIRLDRGGRSWHGWRLGPYGNARDWRLAAPTGENFTADDVMQARAFVVEVDYLNREVKQLRALTSRSAYHFTEDQLAALYTASVILSETFNPRARRRA